MNRKPIVCCVCGKPSSWNKPGQRVNGMWTHLSCIGKSPTNQGVNR